MDAKTVQAQLDKAKAKVARLEGQRDQIIQQMDALGHRNLDSIRSEIDSLEEHIRTTEPTLTEQYERFTTQYRDLLETL